MASPTQPQRDTSATPGPPSEALQLGPLDAEHVRLGARMVPFAGYSMPLQYSGIVEEHEAVRTGVGVFDVSHMGEIFVDGPGATTLLQRTTPNDVVKLKPGRAHYSSLLTEKGTFVDDILVYKLGEDRFMVVVNASNAAKDFAWIHDARRRLERELPGPAELRDRSKEVSLLAIQGPRALELVGRLHAPPTGAPAASELKYYGFQEGGSLAGAPLLALSRTGYTGEDGFEAYLDAGDAARAWRAIVDAGAKPCGLGARDTLRLEAGMCLYGNDIDDTTTPVEAGLEWTVKAEKGDFTGRDVLARQLASGTERRLVGLEMTGRGIARPGHSVVRDGAAVGRVTSGTHSPTLGKAIAMAYVATDAAAPGTALAVDVRGKAIDARVTPLPFHSRKR